MTNEQQYIINGLSEQIARALHRHENERYNPGGNPDASDYLIKVTGQKVLHLRRIRDELENLFTVSEVEHP